MNIQQLQEQFIAIFGHNTQHTTQTFFCPGRVCLIGEHIDYNGGIVVPAAISLGIYAVARLSNNDNIHLYSTLDNKAVNVSLQQSIEKKPEHGWANYPLGMVHYFLNQGHQLQGCEILFVSTLPVGSGLSSSAAIEVLTGYILVAINNIEIHKKDLALAAKAVENNFIGVQCGIMDQFVVTFGEKDKAILLNCNTLKYEMLPLLLNEHNIVILNTKKKRELADSTFNIRVKECSEALHLIQQQHAEVFCLADATEDMAHDLIKDEILLKRALHVIQENIRVKQAATALKNNDIKTFGQLLFNSHDSLKNNYEVSGKELDTFIDFCLKFNGCIGAKMTGAGFGGCAVAIVEKKAISDFQKKILAHYKNETGIDGETYVAQISEGVSLKEFL